MSTNLKNKIARLQSASRKGNYVRRQTTVHLYSENKWMNNPVYVAMFTAFFL
jgi:hypothetical protein